MRKKVILFLFLILVVSTSAQKVIHMEKDGGVYKIPCVVNGAKMKMVFDTGASSVSLSMSIANFLYENDYITKEDIVGKGKSQTADGSIVNHVVVNLRDIEIGGFHLKNIEATVIDGQNAPLLLGQSALKQLGSYTINGSSLILNEVNDNISDEELEELDKKIEKAIDNHQYYSAIEYLRKIESAVGLSTIGYIKLVRCYDSLNQYEQVIETGKEGLKCDDITDLGKSVLCSIIGRAYCNIKDYSNSIKYNELSLLNNSDLYDLSLTFSQIASCYNKMGNQNEAERNYKKAINRMMEYLKISMIDIYEGKVSDKNICTYFYLLSVLFMDDYDKKKCVYYAELGAMCHDKDCISICEHYDRDYKKSAKNMLKVFKDSNTMDFARKQYGIDPE